MDNWSDAPYELMLGVMCRFFRCLPSEIEKEDARMVFRVMEAYGLYEEQVNKRKH